MAQNIGLTLTSFFSQLSERICSSEFVADVRHVLAPQAFTRNRKLPLPKLIAALVSMRSSAVQVALDSFFGSLGSNGDLQRVVSDRAFAKARDHLSWTGLQRLNSFVVNLADTMGLIPRWHGLRVVAADASDFMPAVRAYKPKLQPKALPNSSVKPNSKRPLRARVSIYSRCTCQAPS
ncbi:MAG: hypothetical protein K9J77_11065 [Rhodoferax sp.]|nr:hypothetical protein [Rhodoferax sp.]